MNDDHTQLLATVGKLCAQIISDHAEARTAAAVPADPVPDLDRDLIAALDAVGLLSPELLDAEDGEPAASAVIAAVASSGAGIPIVEHLWNAHHLLRRAGLTPPPGILTAASAPDLDVDRVGDALVLSGTIDRVPWGDRADHLVLLLSDGEVAWVRLDAVRVESTRSLLDESWSRLVLEAVRVPGGAHGPSALSARDFRLRNATGRLLQIRAAAEAAVDLTVAHLSTREQFGRALRKFQAAQNRLSICVGELLLLGIGVDLALNGAAADNAADIAAARVDARRSVTVIREHTHQLHGAIGVTAEHPLGRLGANMLAWLHDTGPDREWSAALREDIATRGAWALITGEEDEQ